MTHLVLGIEVDATASIERHVAEEARLVPAPREHGQRHRNGHVDADLADLNACLELACGRAALREDRCAVSVFVRVDDGERIVEGVGGDDGQNGAENLLPVHAYEQGR